MTAALAAVLLSGTTGLVMSPEHLPFSRAGCWLAASVMPGMSGTLDLHDAYHIFGQDRFLRLGLSPSSGDPVVPVNRATWVDLGGRGRVWVVDDLTMGVETEGLSVDLRPLRAASIFAEARPTEFRVRDRTLSFETGDTQSPRQAVVRVVEGKLAPSGQVTPAANGRVRFAVRIDALGKDVKVRKLDPEAQIASAEAEWSAFRRGMPKVRPAHREAAEHAWYALWAATLRKQGPWPTDAIVMSKVTMNWVWSWDHCFNALALGRFDMDRAMDQWMLPFAVQDERGCLPDMWKPPARVEWYATKPPIHGWALSRLMDMGPIPRRRLQPAYDGLVKWTEFWFTHRDRDGDGVPSYLTSGNDSGWDNSTLFLEGAEVESPELSGYLLLQMRALARAALALGRQREAAQWTERADAFRTRLFRHSWTGERFVAKKSGTEQSDPNPTSMLPLMTLAMGEELEPEMVDRIVALLQPFLTEHGPGTELRFSPHYRADGYWRGPIWAPTTYLLIDGLRRAGREDLARDLATRFTRMVTRSGGTYENYDAVTGKGLCAPGYTWTASVQVLLLHEALNGGWKQ